MNRDFDFLIVGGGITGSVMASLLVNRKLAQPARVAIVTGGAPPAVGRHAASGPAVGRPAVGRPADSEWDLRVFALSRASRRLLSLCGAWQGLPGDKVFAYERMCVWEARGGPPTGVTPWGVTPLRVTPPGAGSLTFDCAELGEPNLGYIVEGRALQAQCQRAAAALGIVAVDAGIVQIRADESRVRVSLTDGRELEGRLLIAADGADSAARTLLGIETAGHGYHQDALVAHVRTAKPHRNTAWQRFLPSGPLAFLPMPDGRSSIVWSAECAQADRLRSLDAAAFGAELTTAGGEVLGACELTTPIASFPLRLQYALDYARPRAVLVGDAAHAVHPLAGQGLNLGLLDCATLAEVLEGAADVGEYGALRRYERRRKSENLLAATTFDGLERLFSSRSATLASLRMAGLGAVGRVPFIKRRLAERAMGLGDDVPGFLKAAAGEPF